MKELVRASGPFKLCTRLHLSELTGLKASNLNELLELIKTVSGSCIYHHTHRFLQQHQYLSPEPPNDFAYWVETFWDDRLGRKTCQYRYHSISHHPKLAGKNHRGHRRISAKIPFVVKEIR